MTNKVAIILSGCGVYDGSEVHEASACCVALSRAGKQVVFYSLDNGKTFSIIFTINFYTFERFLNIQISIMSLIIRLDKAKKSLRETLE